MVKFEDPGINGSQFVLKLPANTESKSPRWTGPVIVSELSVIPQKKKQLPMANHIGYTTNGMGWDGMQ